MDKDISREKLKEGLKRLGVNLSGEVYSTPCHLQQVFKDFKKGNFPIAEDLCNRQICLPIFPTMKKKEVDYVTSSIKKVLGESI